MALTEEFINEFQKTLGSLQNSTLNQINELYKTIETKDNIIQEKQDKVYELETELTQLKQKMSTIIDSYRVEMEEIQKKIETFEELIDNTRSREIVIISKSADIFKYPAYVLEAYLDKMNWSSITIDEINELIRGCIEHKYFAVADQLIKRTCIIKFNIIKRSELNSFISLVTVYIREVAKCKEYLLEGIYYLLTKTTGEGKTSDLKDLIISTQNELINIINNAKTSQYTDLFIIELLKTVFLLSIDEIALKLIDTVIIGRLRSKKMMLNNSELVELLFIMTYYKKEVALCDCLSNIEEIMNLNVLEIECYKVYADGLSKAEFTTNSYRRINELCSKCSFINNQIKEKVIKQMLNNLKEKIDKSKKTLLVNSDKKMQSQNNKGENKAAKNIRGVDESNNLNEIAHAILQHDAIKHNNSTSVCIQLATLTEYVNKKLNKKYNQYIVRQAVEKVLYRDYYIDNTYNANLKNRSNKGVGTKAFPLVPSWAPEEKVKVKVQSVNIIYDFQRKCFCGSDFKNKVVSLATTSTIFVDASVLYCEKCKKHYMRRKQYNEQKSSDTYTIKGQMAYPPANLSIDEFYNICGSKYDKYNEQSFLHMMGYNVSDIKLSTEERLSILKDSVRYFGMPKVISHIKYLIEDRSNQRNGYMKFNKAIEIWENDLKYLSKIAR